MSAPWPAAPLLLSLLTTTSTLAGPTPEAWDTVAARHLELTAESAGLAHEVRISPGLITTLVFNAPLLVGGVVLEEREGFRVVTVDEATGIVMLLPSSELPAGNQLRLTVRFADGAVPESVTFRLVVHPTRAEPQVNVYRQPRSAESLQWEALQAHERAERCETRLAQLQTEEEKSPGGLTGLIDSGLVKDEEGIAAQDISDTARRSPREALKMKKAFSYRAAGRVAVVLEVDNMSAEPWTVDAEGALLVGKGGERLRVLRVWQPLPIAPGEKRRVVVEAEATEEQSRGDFLLKLGEAGGPRTITLRGVTFP